MPSRCDGAMRWPTSRSSKGMTACSPRPKQNAPRSFRIGTHSAACLSAHVFGETRTHALACSDGLCGSNRAFLCADVLERHAAVRQVLLAETIARAFGDL